MARKTKKFGCSYTYATRDFLKGVHMLSRMSSWTKKNSLVAYVLLAYAMSWAVEIPLALNGHRGANLVSSPVHIHFGIHYLAAYGAVKVPGR